MVLFGGDNGRAVFGTTWTFSHGVWTRRRPARSPSPRTGATMVYDAATAQLLLFGGSRRIGTSGGFYGGTWVWTGRTWRRLHPATSPPARRDADMIYDAATENVVLFGGYDGRDLGDTWTWNGTTWRRRCSPCAPAPRDKGSFVFDAADGTGVLYGGFDGTTGLTDTWTWDGIGWTQQHPANSPAGSSYAWMAAYDPSNQQVLLGATGGDIFAWKGLNWNPLGGPDPSPVPRANGSMADNTATDRVMLFGGRSDQSPASYLGDLWAWYQDSWQPYGPAPRLPTPAWLNGVTATSGRNAWAVGADGTPAAPLVEHWNGRRWKQVPSGLPPSSDGVVSLAGVAATSATNAWTVGTIGTQYLFSLADRWDGHKWTESDIPEPGGFGGSTVLTGVAASSAKDAWAVGNSVLDATETLVLHWNGNGWVQVPSPSPAGTGSTAASQLQAVTAPSPTNAWAVGAASTGHSPGPWTTVTEHWNGTTWATVPSPDPALAGCVNDQLNGVASRAGETWAVGSYCGAPLVLRLTGGSWRQVPIPSPPAGTSEELGSVAVISKTNAWIVGTVGSRVLILHWNGKKWATVRAPIPAGVTSAGLQGVSAVSPSIVWAVGQAYFRSALKPLIERWNGTRWKLQSVPNPS